MSNDVRRLTYALVPGAMLAGIAGGIAFPILPSIGLRVGLPLALIGLILAANRITRVIVNPIVGIVTDRFGGRRTLLAGLALQIAVMLLFDLGVRTTHTGFFLLVGRIVHGVGSSLVFVAAQALALHGGGKEHGGRLTGAVRAGIGLGVPLGLVLGGFLADLWGEARTFEAAAVALVLALAFAFVRLPDLRVVAPKTHLLVTLRTLGGARLGAIGALSFAAAFAGSGMVLTMTSVLVHARHLSIHALPERATASVLMGWLVITEVVSMPLVGRAGDRHDAHAAIAAFGLFLTVPALIAIAFFDSALGQAIGLGVLGTGVGCLGPSLLALVGKVVPPERRGLGVGALQVTADVGGSLGPLCGSALLAGSLSAPYLVAAGVNAALLPLAIWLVKASRTTITE